MFPGKIIPKRYSKGFQCVFELYVSQSMRKTAAGSRVEGTP